MNIKNNVKIDKNSFEWIKTTVKLISKHKKNSTYAASMPEEVGLQLTYRCNLRCPHCFQLNDNGFFHSYNKDQELDLKIIEKIINDTNIFKSRLYLWGGEPLIYKEWDSLIEILIKNPRQSVICTNSLLLPNRIESILKLPVSPNFLISLDGLEDDHEIIRGKKTFYKVIENIHLLQNEKKKGRFNGHVSVNCVINDYNVDNLYEFASFCEGLKIDTLYLCFPWYISEGTVEKMNSYMCSNFPNLIKRNDKEEKYSWYSYNYHLDYTHYNELANEITRLNQKIWKMNLRFNPRLHISEIKDFILGKDTPAQNRSKCLAISNRMDVLADGTVSACKHFPEFAMGNLHTQSIAEIWNGDNFKQMRKKLNSALMPVCSKCILLYQSGQ